MILSYKDLSQRWGITVSTLRQWKQRGKLPDPDLLVGKSPAWYEETIQTMEDNGYGHTGSDPETG